MSEGMLCKIENFLEGVSLKSLLSSSKKISNEYRLLGRRNPSEEQEEDVFAYLVTRMPATYAALSRVFHQVKASLRSFEPLSLLDVGSGPGTTLWAAAEWFSQLKEIHCLEKDPQFLSIGKHLSEELWLHSHVQWLHGDMRKKLPDRLYDLVVASYSIGEVQELERLAVLDTLWALTGNVLILIEPGTPIGFERLRAMRKRLLHIGAFLIGPCPHSGDCPMAEGNWCHFYARLNRSSMHRRAKEAKLNYEDEKFSYLAFSRTPVELRTARILRHPRKGKGHVQLNLCTAHGIQDAVVTKKEGELYRLAKKSEWGDAFITPS